MKTRPLSRNEILISFLVTLFLCLFSISPACAANEPPEKPVRPQTLEDIRKALDQEKKTTEDLARQVEKARNGLESTRGKLVTLGRGVKENEGRIREIDARIQALVAEETAIRERLGKDEGALSDLLLALGRLRRVPPESMILRPASPLDMARSALILKSVLPDIQKRAEELRADINRLSRIRTDLESNRAVAATENARLETAYTEMNTLLKEREALYGQTRQAHDEKARAVEKISERARTIADLLTRLEKEEKDRQKQQEAARLAAKTPRAKKPDTPLPEFGNAQTPVSGIVRTRYGEKNDMGARNEGITIEGRSSGVVVAPMGGVVRYAGPFRRFGNIVIIEHQKGFHSLLAGLGKIDTVVGRNVSAGEPLGFLGAPDQGRAPSLYYELRLDGRPVDPAKKLADLG